MRHAEPGGARHFSGENGRRLCLSAPSAMIVWCAMT